MSTPSTAQLKQAISIAEQIEKLQAELASLLGGSASVVSTSVASVAAPKSGRGGKRTMSPATIAKMRAAQQARWAKKRGEAVPASSDAPAAKAPKAGKKKRVLSPEGRARIVAALKKRWAKK